MAVIGAVFGRWLATRGLSQATSQAELTLLRETEQSLKVHAMLTEYNSLRHESMTSINNRIIIANFTFGALAIMLAALITQSRPGLAIGLVSLFFIPQVAKTGLLIWLGEYNRSQRAGRWLKEVERRINEALGHDAMTWEGSLVDRGVHMGYPYLATVLLLLGAGWASSLVGLFFVHARITHPLLHDGRFYITAVLSLYVLAAEILFARFFRNQWRNARRPVPPGL